MKKVKRNRTYGWAIGRIIAALITACMVVCAMPVVAKAVESSYGVNIGSSAYKEPANVFYQYEGQCTWYCYGRALEKVGVSIPCRGHAGTWYNSAQESGWSVGSTARANSIAVFSGGDYGHVVFIEELSGTVAKISEYNFNNNQQYHEDTFDTSQQSRYGLSLVGYIYLGDGETNIGSGGNTPVVEDHDSISTAKTLTNKTEISDMYVNRTRYYKYDAVEKGPVCFTFNSEESSGDKSWNVSLVRAVDEQEKTIKKWEIEGEDGGINFRSENIGLEGEVFFKVDALDSKKSEYNYSQCHSVKQFYGL